MLRVLKGLLILRSLCIAADGQLSTEEALSWARDARAPKHVACHSEVLSCCSTEPCADVNETYTPSHGGTEDCAWYGQKGCFSLVYTSAECCYSASAMVAPYAKAQASCPRAVRPGQRRVHPAFELDQLRFEQKHRRATRFYEVSLLGVTLKVADFKGAHKVRIVADELLGDPYGLIALAAQRTINATFIDIGANLGMVSMLLAKLNPTARVLSFEPVPEIYRYLLWNVKMNGLEDRVWPLNAGVGREGCKEVTYPLDAMMWWLPSDLPAGSSSCLSFAEVLAFAEVLVGANLQSSPAIDFLKIDCEGCEYDAFGSPGSLALARQHVRRFAGEVHASMPCQGASCAQRALAESPALAQVLELLCGQEEKRVQECDYVLEKGHVDEVALDVALARSGLDLGRCIALLRSRVG